MKLHAKTYIIGLLAFLLTNLSGFSQNKKEALNQYFTALAIHGQFNGNVLVAENGKIIYAKSFGYADFSVKKPTTMETSFAVASITKTIVSTAILQLQEKGKLNINDNYRKYFTSFPYPSVTIKQLLSHTSRIPSPDFYRFMDSVRMQATDTFFTNADVIPALIAMNKPLVGAGPGPGRADFAYSNVNYYLLALLIEKLTGMPYASYLKKNIFLPAGMDNTSLSEFYFGLDRNQATEQRFRYLYSETPERIDTVASNAYIFTTYNFKGHGDVVSTVGDLFKYDQALYNGTLLNENSLKLAFDPVVPGNQYTSGYALGWSVVHDSSKGKVVQHHGGGIGIEAMLVRNISKHQTVILYDNMKNPAFIIAMNALKILNGEKIPVPRKSIARVYGRTIFNEGIPAARKLLSNLRKDSLNYSLYEDDMNLLAYQLMRNGMDSLAYEVFKTDLELFPNSWNVYDSYGEILLKMGRKEEAIKMYKRSMELNPDNENGRKVLEEMEKGIR